MHKGGRGEYQALQVPAIGSEEPLLFSARVVDLRDHCVMDFSQSGARQQPRCPRVDLLALAVIGTLLLVAFQAAA